MRKGNRKSVESRILLLLLQGISYVLFFPFYNEIKVGPTKSWVAFFFFLNASQPRKVVRSNVWTVSVSFFRKAQTVLNKKLGSSFSIIKRITEKSL